MGVMALALGDHLGLATWGVALLFSPILLLEGVFRLRVRQILPGFRTKLMARIQAGANAEELLDLYKEQSFLRFAAPRHVMMGWLARIHGHAGSHALAAKTYGRALEECPQKEAHGLALSLGDAQYELGESEEAERTYRMALTEEHRSARACANLSRIILDRDGDLEEAENYLTLAVESDRGGMMRLDLVQLLLRLDKREDAQWQLDLAAEELESGSAGEEAMARLQDLRNQIT